MARVLTFVLAYVAALVIGIDPAVAQGQAWCLISSGPPTRCSFYTFEQCLASRAGGSSHCSPNTPTTRGTVPTEASPDAGRLLQRP